MGVYKDKTCFSWCLDIVKYSYDCVCLIRVAYPLDHLMLANQHTVKESDRNGITFLRQ